MRRAMLPVLLTIGGFIGGCAASGTGGRTAHDQATVASQASDPLEASLSDLSNQIVAGLKSKDARRIAIAPFQDLNGKISEFGVFVAEEMTTRLYKTNFFQVVEREMLNRVMDEHDLAATGLIDEDTAKEIGKLLGVDAIATGTITDLTSNVRINSRLIATETGSVFSAAAVSVPRTRTVEDLMGKVLVGTSGSKARGKESTSRGTATRTGYHEDFSEVAEGYLPEGWIGGEHLHVCPDPSRKGRMVLKPFEGGPYRVTIPDVGFPENWRLTVDFMLERRGGGSVHSWQIGPLTLQMRNTGVILKDTMVKRNFDIGKPARLELIKEGPVFKLFIDTQKLTVVRVDSFTPPQGMTISDSAGFRIYSIDLDALP